MDLLCDQESEPQAQPRQKLLFKHQTSDRSGSSPSTDAKAAGARIRSEQTRQRREMERMSKSQRAKMLRMQREQRRLLRPERSMNAQEADEVEAYIKGGDGIITQTWNNTLAYHQFAEEQLYGLRNILPLMVGHKRIGLRCAWLVMEFGSIHFLTAFFL